MIFVQNKDGTLTKVLDLAIRLLEDPFAMPRRHAPLAVLKEKTAEFYAIVLPGSNRILRYDKEISEILILSEEGHAECQKIPMRSVVEMEFSFTGREFRIQ